MHDIFYLIREKITWIKANPFRFLFILLLLALVVVVLNLVKLGLYYLCNITSLSIAQLVSLNLVIFWLISYAISIAIQRFLSYKTGRKGDYTIFNVFLIKSVNIYSCTILVFLNFISLYYNVTNKVLVYLGIDKSISLPKNTYNIPMANIDVKYYQNNQFMLYLKVISYVRKPTIWEV